MESSYSAGLKALDDGHFEEARTWAARCEAAPGGASDARSAALRGAIDAETGNLESARAHFQRAIKQAPKEAEPARELAEVLSTSGAFAEAATVLEGATKLAANDAALHVDLGYARMLSGDRSGARDAAGRAASLEPDDEPTWRSLARLYEALGEPALAAQALGTGARLTPSPRALTDLARLYLQLERYADAETSFESLATADPEHELVARHGQTFCRIKRGDWRGALDIALSATRLDRLDLTTAFLGYAKDRLFTRVPDAQSREADLAERFQAELAEHDELHSVEGGVARGGKDLG